MAHPKLQLVRERYAYCCGYCGVSETDTGGELTVDHFRPVSAGRDDSDENLVYACIRCNQHKGKFIPEATDTEQELHLLHPLQDNLTLHLYEDKRTGRLEGLTRTGIFHIEALRLNRSALIAHRLRRRLFLFQEERMKQMVLENAALNEQLERRDLYIVHLEERLK